MRTKYLASMKDWNMFMYHKSLADNPEVWGLTRSEHKRAVSKWLLDHEFHERTCRMTLKKSGPFFDVYYFDCCEKEYAESRCVDGQSEISGEVCPYCGVKVIGD